MEMEITKIEKKKNGFTLIELLVTIALLAVIVTISFVSINAAIEKNKTNSCNSLKESIKTAGKEYVSDKRYDNSYIKNVKNYTTTVKAKTLIDENYLTGPIVNPFTKEDIDSSKITLTVNLYSDYTVKSISITGSSKASFINECKK